MVRRGWALHRRRPWAARCVGTRESQNRKAQRWSCNTRDPGEQRVLRRIAPRCVRVAAPRAARRRTGCRWRIEVARRDGGVERAYARHRKVAKWFGKTAGPSAARDARRARHRVASAPARHHAASASRWCAGRSKRQMPSEPGAVASPRARTLERHLEGCPSCPPRTAGVTAPATYMRLARSGVMAKLFCQIM